MVEQALIQQHSLNSYNMPKKHPIRKKIGLLFLIFFLVVIIWGIASFFVHFGTTASHILLHPAPSLRESDGRVNVLLLGIGGGTHDGPDLTDTIIYAGLDAKDQKITLVSVPRDTWIPSLQDKINIAYANGESNGQNNGKEEAKKVVEEVTGQPIDYVFRIDFQGFVKVIDELGGIDVNVQHTLDDYEYPISGKEDDTCGLSADEIKTFTATDSAETDIQQKFACRYMHLHFDPGMQHMDGTTALEYVRSRHAIGEEGTDFARSRRQQIVIAAVRQKVFSLQTLLNPAKVIAIYNIVQGSIDTNIKDNELLLFIQLAQKLQHAKINSAVLDFGDATQNRYGLLENGPIDAAHNYADTLIPRAGDGNFTEIHQYIACVFLKGACTVPAEPQLSPWITPIPVKKK